MYVRFWKELQADKEVVLAAVRQDGGALEYAAESLKADEVVQAAAEQSREIAGLLEKLQSESADEQAGAAAALRDLALNADSQVAISRFHTGLLSRKITPGRSRSHTGRPPKFHSAQTNGPSRTLTNSPTSAAVASSRVMLAREPSLKS